MRRPLIAVVGASRPDPASVKAAEALGHALVDAGYRILCGGRGGVMAAVCKGARSSEAWTDGATVALLPGEDATDANAWVDIAIPTGLGLARNALIARAGDAMVAVGGSAGTLSELALAWQMGRPIAALHTGEGWASQLAGTAIDDRDRPPIHRCDSPDDVLGWLVHVTPTLPLAPDDAEV